MLSTYGSQLRLPFDTACLEASRPKPIEIIRQSPSEALHLLPPPQRPLPLLIISSSRVPSQEVRRSVSAAQLPPWIATPKTVRQKSTPVNSANLTSADQRFHLSGNATYQALTRLSGSDARTATAISLTSA